VICILGKFLVTNYKRAKEILSDTPSFEKVKVEMGIKDNSVFKDWLTEEREYLQSRGKESSVETWEMQYLRSLIELLDVQ